MRVQFQLIDSRHARWHGKVAQAAAERVASLVQSFAYELGETLAAETAPNENTQVTICRQHIDERMIVSVIFAAANWKTVASSTGDATEQLASAATYFGSIVTTMNLRRRRQAEQVLLTAQENAIRGGQRR